MKHSNTSDRLKQILRERNLTQKELLELCLPWCEKLNEKMDRSYISKWIKGEYEPNQKKLSILGLALNVSETWLMGYDVSQERDKARSQYDVTAEKLQKLDMFDLGKVDSYVDSLLTQTKYVKDANKKIA